MTDDFATQNAWVPDLRTLTWASALGEVSAENLAQAMAHDVPLRVTLSAPLGLDVWRAAADAAYEATWWPLIRTAKRMHGLRDEDAQT